MKINEFLSTKTELSEAIEEVLADADRAGFHDTPDLAVVFQSLHEPEELSKVGQALRTSLGVDNIIGCSAESTIGGNREIEGQPALAVWLAKLPGVRCEPFHVRALQTTELDFAYYGLPKFEEGEPASRGTMLTLGEPFSIPMDHLLQHLDTKDNTPAVIGGMASGGQRPRQNRLLLGETALEEGAVGVYLTGPVAIRTVVSQGCRPFGKRFVITELDGNALLKLSGKSAFACLQEAFADLKVHERELFQTGPLLGLAMNELKHSFGCGDFLVRNVMGADPSRGSIIVNDNLRRGQTVQFHVRDADSAREDLSLLLEQEQQRLGSGNTPAGGLLFNCNGRGSRLFGRKDHDIGVIRSKLGEDMPLSGFFAGGEIGPVGGKNFLHGFTASLALFSPV